MRRGLVIALLLSLFYEPAPASARMPPVVYAEMALERGVEKLGFDLYAQVRDQPGNLVLSPAGIAFALGMVHRGAMGRTRDQIASVLHIERVVDRVDEAFAGMFASLRGRTSVQLRIANRMWVAQGQTLDKGFLAATRKTFGAGLAQADFARRAPAARKAINAWVATTTAGHIVDLLPADSVTASTAVVLVNAIWFKGTWAKKFDKKLTHDAPFTLPSGEVASVKTMARVGPARFGKIDHDDTHLKVLELDYAAKGSKDAAEVSMIVLLPDDPKGFHALELALDHGSFEFWDGALDDRDSVDIELPRFTVKSPLPLAELLTRLGMGDAFSDGADFSGMVADHEKGLHLSGAFHQAFVAVDESGTEAAAATAMTVAVDSVESVPTFHADHPFIWLIRDRETGLVLFLGRVADPR